MPSSYSLRRGYSVSLHDSISEISVKWNRLNKYGNVFLSSEYLSAVEHSGQENLDFLYCMVFSDNVPVAALYFQLIDLAHVRIGSVVHSEPYGKFLKLASDKISHSLFGKKEKHFILVNGNMNASGEFAIVAGGHEQELAKLYIDITSKAELYLRSRGKVSVYIIKDLAFEKDYLGEVLAGSQFNRFVMDPVMVMDIDQAWTCFPDYLQSLSAKYRLRAANAIEKTEAFTLREITEAELAEHARQFDVLYQNVIAKSPVRLMHPTIQYIYQLKKKLKERFIVKGWFEKKKPASFFTALISRDILYAHHIGIDYHLNRQHALYQNILYGLIDLAIVHKCIKLDYGRTALEIKSSVGAVPVNYAAYIKMNNRMLNHLIAPFLPSSPPSGWIRRFPFRKDGN